MSLFTILISHLVHEHYIKYTFTIIKKAIRALGSNVMITKKPEPSVIQCKLLFKYCAAVQSV